MFYDKLKPLCHRKGITPWRMATDLGISPRTQANWKKGSEPREETKIKIAEYLGVDPSYFDEDKPAVDVARDDLKEAQHALLSASSKLTAEQVWQFAELMKSMHPDD